MTDYVILHRGNCGCASDGWISDSMYASIDCRVCDQSFGFNVPITLDEGRMRMHLSCKLEADLRSN
jgi:hypothetical protein